MKTETSRAVAGVGLFAVAIALIVVALVAAVDLPVLVYPSIVIGLLGGAYLIGISRPGRTV